MDRVQKALTCFKEGFSCSQAVLSAFCEPLGLDLFTALKISQSFGGGMAYMGETCGAVTGAFMVIGLKHGRIRTNDDAAKEKTYELVQEFVQRFRTKHGSILCRELLEYDLSREDEFKEAQEKKLFDELCPKLVQTAAEILEGLISTPEES
ncbi:MAG: C-GCAxxG-C-C family protein [Candidatus Aminicenantes bacterium]|jgi:C_GCAxxG_C_C family probable redox protein